MKVNLLKIGIINPKLIEPVQMGRLLLKF